MDAEVPLAEGNDTVKVLANRALEEWLDQNLPNIPENERNTTVIQLSAMFGKKKLFKKIELNEHEQAIYDQMEKARMAMQFRCLLWPVSPQTRSILCALIQNTLRQGSPLTADGLAAVTGYKSSSMPTAIHFVRQYLEPIGEWWCVRGGGKTGWQLHILKEHREEGTREQ